MAVGCIQLINEIEQMVKLCPNNASLGKSFEKYLQIKNNYNTFERQLDLWRTKTYGHRLTIRPRK